MAILEIEITPNGDKCVAGDFSGCQYCDEVEPGEMDIGHCRCLLFGQTLYPDTKTGLPLRSKACLESSN